MSKIDIKELAREARREYARQWRAANKDRVKVYNEKYWEKRVAKQIVQEANKDGKREEQ